MRLFNPIRLKIGETCVRVLAKLYADVTCRALNCIKTGTDAAVRMYSRRNKWVDKSLGQIGFLPGQNVRCKPFARRNVPAV